MLAVRATRVATFIEYCFQTSAVQPGTGREPPGESEVVLVDVGGVEDGRVAEQHDALVAHGEGAAGG